MLKNFLSQNWVTSCLVIVAIILIAVPVIKAAKSSKEEDAADPKAGN